MIRSQLDALQFVLRSEDRGLVPAYGCLHFYGDGRVQTSSGIITFDAPWPGNPLSVTVSMMPVIKCMQASPDEKARIVISKKGDLMIKVADFSSKLVPFVGEFPRTDKETSWPEETAAIDADTWNSKVLTGIELLRPFISTDATRPWSQYLLVRNGFLYATNNVALARYEIPELRSIPYDIIIDVAAIDHILRIRDLGHEVESIKISSTALLCEFADGAWTSYRSSSIEWPATSAFDGVLDEGEDKVDPQLLQKLNTIGSIASTAPDGVIYLYEHGAMTQMGDTVARVWCGNFKRGSYMRSSLQQVLGVAEKWSPSKYPSPVQFSGKGVLGIILGMRGANESVDALLQGDDND